MVLDYEAAMASSKLALGMGFTLTFVHSACCLLIAWLDLCGQWKEYALCKHRVPSWSQYVAGFRSFFEDMFLVFLPGVTAVLYATGNYKNIAECEDPFILSALKTAAGYILGKFYAMAVHRILHFPRFYWIHKKHHATPTTLAASCAWLDSFAEYLVMEMPAFVMQIYFFPTHYIFHLAFFVWHGWGAAGDHCGFSAPGWLGWAFDGEYHYYHHTNVNVNYAEMEFMDKLFGTHSSQWKKGKEDSKGR